MERGGKRSATPLWIFAQVSTKAPSPLRSAGARQMNLSNVPMKLRNILLLFLVACGVGLTGAQTRHPKRATKTPSTTQAAPRGSAAKYSAFLHSSEKHQSIACSACHKLPTDWTAKRDFPDTA